MDGWLLINPSVLGSPCIRDPCCPLLRAGPPLGLGLEGHFAANRTLDNDGTMLDGMNCSTQVRLRCIVL